MRRIKMITLLFVVAICCSTMNSFAQPQDVLVDMCASKAGDDATYLKDFVVELAAAGPGEKAPIAKFSMVLSKGTLYRLSVCNAEDSQGDGIIKLFDTAKQIGSNYIESTGQMFEAFDFQCDKTGVYHVFISFKEGKSGSAIGILSFIKKL